MKNVYGAHSALVAAIVLLSSLQAASAQTAEDAAGPGNAIAGRELYFEHACYACHGYTGETGVRVLVGSGLLQSEELFRTYLRLRAEQNPTLPSTQMPNFPEESLSDEDVSDLYAYVRTFESNAPELGDIPVLNAIIEGAARPNEP